MAGPVERGLMDLERARAIALEAQRRRALNDPPYVKDCFPRQREFIFNRSRFKAWQAGRRGGKTETCKRGLLMRMGRYPETTHVYVGLTKDSARRLLWRPAERLAKKHDLPIQWNKVELTAYHANGSELWILGADKEDDMEKLRGPHYKTVVIDEAASYRAHLEDLILDVIEPALGDDLGELWLIGSPGRAPAGAFWKATQGLDEFRDYRVWKSNVLDNPKFPQDAQKWLLDTRKRRGWAETHPRFRREYLGEWVSNDDALVYKFSDELLVDALPVLPDGEYYHLILGIDFGVVDPNAFVVWAYSDHDPNLYCLEATQRAKMSVSDTAEHLKLLQLRFRDVAGAQTVEETFEAMVGDAAAKSYLLEFEQRHGLMVRPADKREKLTYIDHFNSDLLAKRIRFVRGRCEPYTKEMRQLVWREAPKSGGNRLLTKYDERLQDDHCCDAGLYGWRWAYHYRASERAVRPREGSPEWEEMVERQLLEEDLAEFGEDKEQWWEKTHY